MPGAPKPKPRITTKKGTLINAEMIKQNKKRIELKKVESKNSTRQVKENLRKTNKIQIDSLLKLKNTKVDLKRRLLENGIDARQLRAKGIAVRETLNIFGLEETTRAYGAKRIVSEFGGLEKTALIFGSEVTARSFGGIKRIVGEFGLENAFRAFGFKAVNNAHRGISNLEKIYGVEKVFLASQAAIGVKNPDYLGFIREYRKHNGITDTANRVGIRDTGRALGLSTGDMKELARRLKKK